MVKNANKLYSKVSPCFQCKVCDYTSCHKGNFNKHNLTVKHKMLINANEKLQKLPISKQLVFTCNCGKTYKYHSCLSRHKNVCNQLDNGSNKNTEGLLKIIKSNQDLIIQQNKQISELTTNKPAQVINNTQTNIQNNVTFNLNCFLNNTCKDLDVDRLS